MIEQDAMTNEQRHNNESLLVAKLQYGIAKDVLKGCMEATQAQLYELSGMKRKIDSLQRAVNKELLTRAVTLHKQQQSNNEIN
jgi:hypothetical protein